MESSDELNPEVSVKSSEPSQPPGPRTPLDYLALAIATVGVGFFPIAPGTLGSLVGVLIFVASRRMAMVEGLSAIAIELVLIVIITLLGIWAATQTERLSGRKDPGKVVIDEVAGQMISLFPLLLFESWPVGLSVIISFTLFRCFDIVKPYPARRFERLSGGLGVMADDLVAGVYGAIVTIVAMQVLSNFVVEVR